MNEILEREINAIKRGERDQEVIVHFLEEYYEHYIQSTLPGGLSYEVEDCPYPEELSLPLEKRKSGICDAVNWLIEAGYDPNEGACFNPLMMAVWYEDAFMTEFLISNGADAHRWPDMLESEPNIYIDHLDIAYFDKAWPLDDRFMQALLETAKVLLRDGKVGSFSGMCLKADAENRTITFSPPRFLY